MKQDGVAAARNALANVSRAPVSETELLEILSTGHGPGHLVRALFEDCSFDTLDRLAATLGVSRATLRAAYARAKSLHAASNPGFDTLDGTG